MSELSLVVMAAGLGSRFGGNKQLEQVGPDGEAFLDFSLGDAAAAGITDQVLIVRTDIAEDMRGHLRRRYGTADGVRLVMQDELGPPRPKPWGTAHAILAAAPAIETPFVVVNADDYYGRETYGELAQVLASADDDEIVLVAFELGRTLPATGQVSRGVCRIEDGLLVELKETHGIERREDGRITDSDGNELADDTPVSMNMFGFPRRFVDELGSRWDEFLATHGTDGTEEFLLPEVVADLRAEGRYRVTVLLTSADWIGVTNPDDLEVARRVLAEQRSA